MSDKPSPQDMVRRAVIFTGLRQRDSAEIDIRVDRLIG